MFFLKVIAVIGAVTVGVSILMYASAHLLSKLRQSKLESMRLQLQAEMNLQRKLQDNEVRPLLKRLMDNNNTLVSQLEAAVVLLDEELKTSSKPPAERVQQSLEIYKEFVSAFMKAISVTGDSRSERLDELMEAAGEMYAYKRRPGVQVNVSAPLPHLDGYSNNYILAVVLPLIENASRSAGQGSSIDIKAEKVLGRFEITVSYVTDGVLSPGSAREAGIPTEPGRQEVGLFVVRCLVLAYRHAHFEPSYKDDKISFVITLDEHDDSNRETTFCFLPAQRQ
jgi:hypothetical protein